jgi:hypothetical protein
MIVYRHQFAPVRNLLTSSSVSIHAISFSMHCSTVDGAHARPAKTKYIFVVYTGFKGKCVHQINIKFPILF